MPGTFFDPDTPLGEITKGVFADMKDPSAIYKVVETSIGIGEKVAFTAISRGWMPAQLLFRLSFPLKVMLDGQLRMSTLGVDSLFRNPMGFLKLILNDPEGYLAKGLGIDVDTSLKVDKNILYQKLWLCLQETQSLHHSLQNHMMQ